MMQKITLGGGCFWCLDAVYRRIPGVLSVGCGYAGGETENPDYESVCSGVTGHAEVVQLDYDESKISLEEILKIFFQIHDPTTLNRQGADVGTQYRSVVLYHTEEQKKAVQEILADEKKRHKQAIVTELKPLDVFYEAEIEHQDYYTRHAAAPYCAYVISPKLKKVNLE